MQRSSLLNYLEYEAKSQLTESQIYPKHKRESQNQFTNLSFMCHHLRQHTEMLGECERSRNLLNWDRDTIRLYGTIQDMARGKIEAGVPELEAAVQSLATHGATLGSIYAQRVKDAPGVRRPPPKARPLRLSTASGPTGGELSVVATPTTLSEDALTRRRDYKEFLKTNLGVSLSKHNLKTIFCTTQSKEMAKTKVDELVKLGYFNKVEEVDKDDTEWRSMLEQQCAVDILDAELKARDERQG